MKVQKTARRKKNNKEKIKNTPQRRKVVPSISVGVGVEVGDLNRRKKRMAKYFTGRGVSLKGQIQKKL